MGMASFTIGCFYCTTKRNEEQLTFMLQAFVEMPPLQIGVKVRAASKECSFDLE